MLPVAFLAEKALAGATKGHRVLWRISTAFVTTASRQGLSLDLTCTKNSFTSLVPRPLSAFFFHLQETKVEPGVEATVQLPLDCCGTFSAFAYCACARIRV